MGAKRRTVLKSIASGLVVSPFILHPSFAAFTGSEISDQGKIRVGLIGAGARGSWLAKVARDIPAFQITACCDVLQERAKRVAVMFDGKPTVYSDYRDLLLDRNVDAVIVATPLFLHYPICMEALSRKKHVYCEKTMVLTISEADSLKKQVDRSGLTFQVGYQHRYNPLYKEIKFLLDQGYCGKITQVYASWNRNGDWRRPLPETYPHVVPGYPDMERLINWRMYSAYSGGLMAELCSHQVDIVNWMLESRPVRMQGRGGIDFWKDGRETYDTVNSIFEYPGGITANFSAITSNALLGYAIQFLGNKGSIVIEGEQGHRAKIYAEKSEEEVSTDAVSGATKIAWGQGEGIPIRISNPANDDYLPTFNSLKHFLECIEKNAVPFTNVDIGADAAIAVHLANAAMREEVIKHWDNHKVK